MSLQVTLQPGNVSFAGNQILVKASTSLAGTEAKTFLRIIADVDVNVSAAGATTVTKESYTYTVGSDGMASFNIAGTVKAALDAVARHVVTDGEVLQSLGHATFTVTLTEVYLDRMEEITGSSVTIGPFVGVMGALSEYECACGIGKDVESFMKNGLVLSRKPKGEVVYGQHPVYIPYISGTELTARAVLDKFQGKTEVPVSVSAFQPVSIVVGKNLTEGKYNLSVEPTVSNYRTEIYMQPCDSHRHVSFVFLNGFGVLESITVRTMHLAKYAVNVDHYVEVEPFNQGTSAAINMGGVPSETYELTTGFIDKVWADWFCTEFFPAKKIWMLQNGRYVPVLISPDDKSVVYDQSRPGICEMKFSARNAFVGSIVNTLR